MSIIAGLGNPEKKYDGTRHNAGFEALDELMDHFNLKLKENKFTAVCASAFIDTEEGPEKVLLLKPLTYMNRSGDSIKAAADYYKVPVENIIVIYDDISFPVGKLRVRGKGSAGGHNGIKSIIARLGSENFPRVRIGVGGLSENEDMISHVLGHFSAEDQAVMRETYRAAGEAALTIIKRGVPEAMNRFNGMVIARA